MKKIQSDDKCSILITTTDGRKRENHFDHPPSVIALSRSQSFGSLSSTDSDINPTNTEMKGKSFTKIHNASNIIHKMKSAEMFRNSSARSEHIGCASISRDFAKRHEVLINSIFDLAKYEFVKSMYHPSMDESISHRSDRDQHNHITVNQVKDTNSSASITTRFSAHSRHSRSTTSAVSEILSHTSHVFKKSLFQRSGIPFARKRIPKHKIVTPNSISYDIDDSSIASFSTDSADFYSGRIAYFLLDPLCELQKDSGAGLEPGSIISVRGREESINKIVEKIIVLAELEQEGSNANAILTRIPAMDTSFSSKDVDDLYSLSETRSMFALKIGFVHFRYGVLVQWNRTSGLAERIVLRKMCPESFMKIKNATKMKAPNKRSR